MSPPHHICIIGSGLTSLTVARTLLSHQPPLPVHVTIIDKARSPGGRLTSRTYDSGVTLETGARVFQAEPDTPFANECQEWETKGWITQVKQDRLKGVGGFQSDLKKIAGKEENLDWKFETTLEHPSPTSFSGTPTIKTTAPVSLAPISLLIHTAPLPQISKLLPEPLSSPTEYIKTFVLLLPSVNLPDSAAIYHRDPHALITSIATGISADGSRSAGLVIQSTPENLKLAYPKEETSVEQIKSAFFSLLRQENLLPEEILQQAESKTGRESQIKRWKFAQVKAAVDPSAETDPKQGEEAVRVLEGGRVILAGDGTSSRLGGVQGAWLAGTRAAQIVKEWIEKNSSADNKL